MSRRVCCGGGALRGERGDGSGGFGCLGERGDLCAHSTAAIRAESGRGRSGRVGRVVRGGRGDRGRVGRSGRIEEKRRERAASDGRGECRVDTAASGVREL